MRKLITLSIVILLCTFQQLNGATYTVTNTNDAGAGSLRQAVLDANANAGADIINFSVNGTIQLTSGHMIVTGQLTINGPGMNQLTISQTTASRVFTTGSGAVTFVLTDVTLTYSGPATPYSGGGGAILAGGAGAATTLTNVAITNFNQQIGNGGAISQSSSLTNHSLTITNCVFTNNKCGGAGGAVSFNSQGGTATITGCTFTNNHTGAVGANTGGDGGAISTTGGGSGGSYLIEKNAFLNNRAEAISAHAGAIINTNGALTVRFNRFIGNTCANISFLPLANIIAQASGAVGGVNTTDANNNWWGVNTGPGTNDAVFLGGGSGSLAATNWLQLKTTASPTPICPTNVLLGNTSTATASFLTNSAGTAINPGNLDRLIGLPINFSAVLGTLSGAQTTIQSIGTATVLFTSNGTPGNGSVNAVVDNIPNTDPVAKASIFINTPASISANPTNTTVCLTSTATFTVGAAGVPAPTFQWRKGTTNLVNGATGTGSTIAGATSSTLTITNASDADEATNYNVVVTNSCASVTSTDASLIVVAPPVVTAPTVTQPTCAVPSGSIVVNATGERTLEYSRDGITWQTSNIFSNLPAPGNYSILVRLQGITGCVSSYSGNPVAISAVPVPPTVTTPTLTQPTCAITSGTILVNATAAGIIEYSNNNGASWQSSNTFSGLAPGNYNISARLVDNTTCVTNFSGNPVTITNIPVPPVMNAPTVTQPTCAVPSGSITVNAIGAGPLEYSQDGGTTWQTSNTFSGLVAGNYNIVARLQNNATCVTSYNSNPVVINAVPTAPMVNAPTITQPNCSQTGTIVINATGSGTLEYSNDGISWQTSNTFSGLSAGSYNISARLQSSPTCVTAYGSNPVVINTPPLAPVVNAPIVTQPTCAVRTGTIVVNATGSSQLEYSQDGVNWQTSNTFNNLPAPGNYNISVRYQNSPGCVTSYSGNPVVINSVPLAPTVNAPTVTQPTCAITNGTIVVNAAGGGTLEYSNDGGVSWQSSNIFSGLAPGNYTISSRLQSSPTCTTNYSGNPVIINAVPNAPVINAPTVTQPICIPPTGTIVVNATATGTLEYSADGFNWQTSSTFNGLAQGNYNISARLQSSITCVSSYSANPVVINAPPPAPVVNAPAVTQPTCPVPTGTIVVNATGGTLEYSKDGINWQSSSTFSGLAAGNYFISVRLQGNTTCVTSYSNNPVVLIAASGCTVPPTFTLCPGTKTVNTDAGVCSATLSLATLLSYVTATGTPAPTLTVKVGSTTVTTSYVFPKGNTTVTITASNGTLPNATCSFTIAVQDKQAPLIKTITNPIVLWPPNHKYETINMAQLVTSVTDNCGNIPIGNVVITKVTSDEADDAPGNLDGNTTQDIRIAANCKSVDLRSERMDGGNGRVYTIYLQVTDGNGNIATTTARAFVLPDQSGSTAVDDGPVYTVYSNCNTSINAITQTTSTQESSIAAKIPERFVTVQNYPNPFNSFTTIRYRIPADAHVSLTVYNSLGQRLAQLVNGQISAGEHTVTFNATGRTAGIYLYRLQTIDANGKPVELKGKMVVAK